MDGFDVNDLHFMKPRNNTLGGQTVVIKLGTKSPTIIIRKVVCTKVDVEHHRQSIVYALDDVHFFKSIDETTLKMAYAHSKEWFGKEIATHEVRALFVPSVHTIELKTKLTDPEVFDIRLQKIVMPDFSSLVGKPIDIVVEILGVYFTPGRFGLSYRTTQIKLLPIYVLTTYSFFDDNDSDFSDAEPN